MFIKSIKQIIRISKDMRQINGLVNDESIKSRLANIELIRQSLNDVSERIQRSLHEPHKSDNTSESQVGILSFKTLIREDNLRSVKEIGSIVQGIMISSRELIGELKFERDHS
jgi:hypothetical protein